MRDQPRVSKSLEGGRDYECDTSADQYRYRHYHYVLGILINDESSCNLIYFRTFIELGLRKQDLK